jgi:hypothetical protein
MVVGKANNNKMLFGFGRESKVKGLWEENVHPPLPMKGEMTIVGWKVGSGRCVNEAMCKGRKRGGQDGGHFLLIKNKVVLLCRWIWDGRKAKSGNMSHSSSPPSCAIPSLPSTLPTPQSTTNPPSRQFASTNQPAARLIASRHSLLPIFPQFDHTTFLLFSVHSFISFMLTTTLSHFLPFSEYFRLFNLN